MWRLQISINIVTCNAIRMGRGGGGGAYYPAAKSIQVSLQHIWRTFLGFTKQYIVLISLSGHLCGGWYDNADP